MLRQNSSTQRMVPRGLCDEYPLVADMIELARQFGRYGYRQIVALLRNAGSAPLGTLLCNPLPASGKHYKTKRPRSA